MGDKPVDLLFYISIAIVASCLIGSIMRPPLHFGGSLLKIESLIFLDNKSITGLDFIINTTNHGLQAAMPFVRKHIPTQNMIHLKYY